MYNCFFPAGVTISVMPTIFRTLIGDVDIAAAIERDSAERWIVEALDEIGAVGRIDGGLPEMLEPDADPVGVDSIGTAAGGLL